MRLLQGSVYGGLHLRVTVPTQPCGPITLFLSTLMALVAQNVCPSVVTYL
jgi:hypothetical protein